MHNIKTLLMCVLITLMFCGCTIIKNVVEEEPINVIEYEKKTYDCGISMRITAPSQIYVNGREILFEYIEAEEDGKSYVTYYCGDVFSNDYYRQIGLKLEDDHYESFAMYPYTEENKDFVFVMTEDVSRNTLLIDEFTCEGEHRKTIEIDQNGIDNEVSAFRINGNDICYFLTTNSIFRYEKSAGLSVCEAVEEAVYKELFLFDQKPCCVIWRKQDNGEQVKMLALYDEGGHLKKTLEIPPNACGFSAYDEIVFYDNKCIYRVNDVFEDYEKVLDFSGEEDWIRNLVCVVKESGNYGIFYQSASDLSFRTMLFDTKTTVNTARKEIVLYDPVGEMLDGGLCSQGLIDSFNEQNQYYHVVVKEYDRDVNYVLESEETPDLIFLAGKSANVFGQAGYLEDLYPYIENDSCGFRDEIIDGLLEKAQCDGQVYLIPRSIILRSLCGRESLLGKDSGWTPDEFVDWLLNHPEALEESWIQNETILEFCLYFALDKYIDMDAGISYLDKDDFGKLLEKIKRVKTNLSDGYISANSGDVMYLSFRGFYGMTGGSDKDPLIYKGIPTSNGQEMHLLEYLGLSILKKSKNKEGAFEFIKYFVNYNQPNLSEFNTSERILNKKYDMCKNERWRYLDFKTVSEKEYKDFWRIFHNAKVLDLDQSTIIDMIMDEVWPYFYDKKSLDQVVEQAHRRVQLFLNEG